MATDLSAVPRRSRRRSRAGAAFRADVEGLRGLAVLLVVLFHADVPGFHGGYIGVDVFFVISGYLITRLLLEERVTTGGVSFARFYARRARRLLPSAALVIVTTTIASVLILSPVLVRPVVHDGLSAGLFASNFRFAGRAADYFASQRAPSPFLHFWSLSVEEQFYAVWPALLVVLAFRRHVDPRRVLAVLAGVFVLSLVASIVVTGTDRAAAFYLLPTRAWELAAGGLLAGWSPSNRGARHARGAIALLGVVVVLVAAVLFDPASAFPGWIALAPVLGTVVVIAAAPSLETLAGRLLGSGPMPWVGRRSYVLYLWHWPLLVLVPIAIGTTLSLGARLAVCLGALVLADATHRLLERPVHESRWMIRPPRRGLVVGAAIVTFTVLVAGVALAAAPRLEGTRTIAATSRPQHVDEVQRALERALSTRAVPANLDPALTEIDSDAPAIFSDGCNAGFEDTDPPACSFGTRRARTKVVLMGDSHAGQWFPALDALARRDGFALVPMTKSSCPAPDITVPRSDLDPAGSPYPECDAWRQRALARIRKLRPAVVIFSSSYGYGRFAAPPQWQAGYERTLRAVEGRAGRVIVLGDVPYIGPASVPECVSEHVDDVRACGKSRADAVNEELLAVEHEVAIEAGAGSVDPSDWVCTAATCPVIVGRTLVWRDNNHLTSAYVRWLTDVLARALNLPEG